MDWQSLGPVMLTVQQIIVDGANGVTQSPRLVSTVPLWHLAVFVAALVATAAAWRGSRRWAIAVLVAAACLPGYRQVFFARADAPLRQAALTRVVEAAQTAYVAAAREALAGLAPGACYEIARDASCIPWGGLHDGMARALGAARRCMGGEPRQQRLFVSACDAGAVTVHLAP